MEYDLLVQSALQILHENEAQGKRFTYRVPEKVLAQPPAPLPPPEPIKAPIFALNSSPPPSPHSFAEMEKRFQQICVPTELPIVIFVPRENAEERAFLEKVAQALLRLHGPTSLISTLTPLPSCKLLLAPLPQKATLHTLSSFHDIPWLPLADIREYLENQDLKRDLWTAIKTLPVMPRSL